MLDIILFGNLYYTLLRPIFKMADSTSIVAVAVCCESDPCIQLLCIAGFYSP